MVVKDLAPRFDPLQHAALGSGILYCLAVDIPRNDLKEVLMEWKEEVPGLRQEHCLMVAARQYALQFMDPARIFHLNNRLGDDSEAARRIEAILGHHSQRLIGFKQQAKTPLVFIIGLDHYAWILNANRG